MFALSSKITFAKTVVADASARRAGKRTTHVVKVRRAKARMREWISGDRAERVLARIRRVCRRVVDALDAWERACDARTRVACRRTRGGASIGGVARRRAGMRVPEERLRRAPARERETRGRETDGGCDARELRLVARSTRTTVVNR